MHCGFEQPARGVVQREPARSRFLKHAFAHEVSEHSIQGVGVAARRRGKAGDVHVPGGDVLSNAQRRHNVETPGSAEIA